jgi:hypothetical protein
MYKDITNNLKLFEVNIPQTIVPNPNNDDYKIGFIVRYFVQKTNDENAHIFEVNQNEYQKLKNNPHWKVMDLKWRIKGPQTATYKMDGNIDDKGVTNSNKAAITRASYSLKNIALYLPNILQFYK